MTRTLVIIFSAVVMLYSNRLMADDRRIESSPELVDLFETLNQVFNDSSDPGHFSYDQDFDIVVVKKGNEYPIPISNTAILNRLKETIESTIELHNLSLDQKNKLLSEKAIHDFKEILGNEQYFLYETSQTIPLGYAGYDVSHEYYVAEGCRVHFETGYAD